MIPVTDIVSLLKAFCRLHYAANQPMHPVYANTVSFMLGECEERLIAMEEAIATSPASVPTAVSDDAENIIHVNFSRSAPPSDGGGAA